MIGDSLLKKRASVIAEETKEAFEDEKRRIEKEIRALKNNITSMEDLSVKTTQDLIVGENLNTTQWVKRRFDIELKLRDLNVELETVNALIKEYFE
jgi:predicted  nucleic acid-binding Zn-ribbon protein